MQNKIRVQKRHQQQLKDLRRQFEIQKCANRKGTQATKKNLRMEQMSDAANNLIINVMNLQISVSRMEAQNFETN